MGVEAGAGGSEGEEMRYPSAHGELFCERGAKAPVNIRDPKKPSAEEVALHDMTHLPIRSSCSHCIRGRWRVADHRVVKEEGVD